MSFRVVPRQGIFAAGGARNAACSALAALALAACATAPPLVEIGGSADGSRITLAPGQALRVTLDANPGSGYQWVVDRPAPAVLQPVGRPIYTPVSTSAPLVGAGGEMTFDFVAGAPGSDTLLLTYRLMAQPAFFARGLSVDIVVQ